MPISYIPYDLYKGYIHHWLVAGPQAIAVQNFDILTAETSKTQIAQRYYEEDSGIQELPVEPGPLQESTFTVGDYEGLWAYFSCAEDHFVDLSAFYPLWHYARAWAYTQLESAGAQKVTLVLTAYGPADMWLNGAHIYRGTTFDFHQDAFEAELREGTNELLVRFAQVGARACKHQFALRLADPVEGLQVQIPTAIEDVAYRNKLEAMFDQAYIDRDVVTRNEAFTVHWPDDAVTVSDNVMIRLQNPSGRIYAESKVWASAGKASPLVHGYDAPPGPLYLRFMPRRKLFYEKNLRVLREIPIWGLGIQSYTDMPYGNYTQRRAEALHHAARGNDLFAEIAKMALGHWDVMDRTLVLKAIEVVNRREVHSALYLVAMLGMLYRWGNHDNFPPALKEPLETCVLKYNYSEHGFENVSESMLMLRYAAEALAGQRYPEQVFSQSGQTGQWHREHGERLALDWLRARGDGGFPDWGAAGAFEAALVALAHLMDLSETEAIWEMVAVIMDKLLFTVALNTYQGVFGAAQGAADVTNIQGGLLSPLAGITRLLWGQGIFNHHLGGIVSLACMEDYAVPPLIPEIAITRHEDFWGRECHVIDGGNTVNKITFRTPDYMLASAQDYRPGERGAREHVWQASLGPEAVVYTTHPACAQPGEGHAPGFWLGNGVLPRVAQWKDVLMAIYHLPEDDWMGYTHAYFPAYAFDAYVIRENGEGQTWAFAQKGEGYIALTASQGLTWMTEGPGAYRELRSYGPDSVWCCQMGRAALDGDFETFQDRVLAQPLTFEGLAIHFMSLRNETLAFAWDSPFLHDGEPLPLSGFKHYENSYCVADLDAPQMEIRSEQYLMRLKFAQDL